MIFVDRAAVGEPAALSRVWQGKTETERAIDHYAAGPGGNGWNGKAFDFSVYKDDEVKEALRRLFHGKCAYCESRFSHVAPEDIEHWRPKGAVQLDDGSEQKPGYYWLAATWSNLLPSCIDCNRRRRQEDARDPASTQSGKEGLFPVVSARWTRHDQADRNGEEPLLLDPCIDDPRQYLEVSYVDKKAVVRELKPEGTRENRRARESIRVFGLNRSELEKVRQEQRLELEGRFEEVRLNLENLPHLPPDRRVPTRQHILTKLGELKRERRPQSTYLLMKLPLIDAFIVEVAPALERLGILEP